MLYFQRHIVIYFSQNYKILQPILNRVVIATVKQNANSWQNAGAAPLLAVNLPFFTMPEHTKTRLTATIMSK